LAEQGTPLNNINTEHNTCSVSDVRKSSLDTILEDEEEPKFSSEVRRNFKNKHVRRATFQDPSEIKALEDMIGDVNFGDNWILKEKSKTKTDGMSKAELRQFVIDHQADGDLEINDDIDICLKEAAVGKYLRSKQTPGSNNFKSKKRIAFLKRSAKRAAQDVEPHGLEPPPGQQSRDPPENGFSTPCDEPPVKLTLAQIERRNELVRIADTPPVRPESPPSELFDMLKEFKLPEGLNSENDSVDTWMSYLENIVILGYQLGKAKSFTEVFVATIAYIKMHTKKSIVREILELIDTISTCEDDAAKNQPMGWRDMSWRDTNQKWDLLKTNTIFTKFSFLMSAAMSLTICEMKEIKWSPFGLKLISVEAAKKQLAAVDVVDALISTFTWCAETGYQVFKERSLRPLLYSDQNMRTFNTECDYVLAHAENVLSGNGEDVQSFEQKTDKVIARVTELKSAKPDGPTAIWLQQRYSELVAIKFKIVAKHRNTAIRFAPIGWSLTGSSSVGKSTLGKLTMKTSLEAMGFAYDASRIITKDMFDAYDSLYTSDVLGLFMDDIGQGKSAFCEVSPTDIIIKFFNNVAATAVKAELNSKGIVFIGFKCGVVTSNLEDLGAREYSNRPEAIWRRFFHARVHIKPEYRIPGGVSLNKNHPNLTKPGANLCESIWEIDLQECHIFESKTGQDASCFRVLWIDDPPADLLPHRKREKYAYGTGIPCTKLDLKEYLQLVVYLSKQHSLQQDRVVNNSNNFDAMATCKKCCLPEPLCDCPKELPEKVVPMSMDALTNIIVDATKMSVKSYIDSWFKPINLFNRICGVRPVKAIATHELSKEMTSVLNHTATPFLISLTPECVFRSSAFQKMIGLWQRSAATNDLREHAKWFLRLGVTGVTLGCLTRSKKTIGATAVGTWMGSIIMWAEYRAKVRVYQQEYMKRRDAVSSSIVCKTSTQAKGAFVISSILVGLKFFHMWWKQRELNKTDPAAMSPDSINSGDSWFGTMMKKLGVTVSTTPTAKNATHQQLKDTLMKSNAFWCEISGPGEHATKCNIFFPRQNVAWLPKHVMYRKSDMHNGELLPWVEVTVYRHNNPGGKFKFKADPSVYTTLDHLDLICIYVPNCPCLRDKIKWLPTNRPTGHTTVTMLSRNKENEISEDTFNAEMTSEAGHKYKLFHGGKYSTKLSVFGSCMSPLIHVDKDPCILGFHIGGDPNAGTGVCQTITVGDAQAMLTSLGKLAGVELSSISEEIPTMQYGRPILASTEVHPLSMCASLDEEAYIDVLGSTHKRSMMKSSVVESVISKHVESVMKFPSVWGPPDLIPNWKAYNATLEHLVNPSDMFIPKELERARQDWLGPLLTLMDGYHTDEDFRPLKGREIVMGIEGKRFLEPMKMSTSMGFPVFGPKNKFFRDIYEGGKLIDRELSPLVKTEYLRIKYCLLSGKRAYPVSCATLKDEPTDGPKVRVFQAGAAAFGMLIREYFLPVARFLSLHPLVAESAVGINCFSPEWEEVMGHTTRFADDNKVIAWDYSKYDVRMNSQMTRAVLSSFIDLAERGGYDDESLTVMHAMVNDITHPLIDWNGTLIMAYNMNTSGNNITVNINGTAGSLYVRLGFFHVYPEAENFRTHVAAITYGDDFKGSVHPSKRDFNFESFKRFLAEYGMKITLPDKSTDVVEFMNDDEADFLKRNSVFIPEINKHLGCLDENSIFKSLHANRKSKTELPETVAASCIETAMHEWFAFGRDHYNMRAKQMKEVCVLANIPVPAVHITYDERVDNWKNKYGSF